MSKDKKKLTPKFDLGPLSKKKLDEHLKGLSENLQGFPVEVFPVILQDIIEQKAVCSSHHRDYTAAAHLSAAATAIGAAVVSKFNEFKVICVLWMILVGIRGINKSFPGKKAYEPFEEKDNDHWRTYEQDLQQFEVDSVRYARKEISQKPHMPVLKKWIVSDITIEALAMVCANNKRGVCSYVDEEAGRLKNMNRYHNGSDQEQYLSLFNGTSFNSDRATKKSIRAIDPCVSTFGTIQPTILNLFAKDNRDENGGRDRVLFVWPDAKRQPWSRKKLDSSINNEWSGILKKLMDELKFEECNGKLTPIFIPFSQEAEELLYSWQAADIANDEEIDSLDRHCISAKIHIYVLRFALILQLLRWACGEAEKNEIDTESAKGAIKLAHYFREQALKVTNHIKNRDMLNHLSSNKRELYLKLPNEFTTAQAKEVNATLGEEVRLPERTLSYWLNEAGYFEKVKYGHYKKRH